MMNKAETLAFSFKQSKIAGLFLCESKKVIKNDLTIRVQGERKVLLNLLANAMAREPLLKSLLEESLAAYEKGPIGKNNPKLNGFTKPKKEGGGDD